MYSITPEFTIPFPEFFGFFSWKKLKTKLKTKTGNFRAVKRSLLPEKEEAKKFYVIQQRNSMMGWMDLNIIHTRLACGRARRTIVTLNFDTKKEADDEIEKIEKRLPSIVEKVFCGGELDRIVREVRDI